MIWNGKETGKWQILHDTKEQYKESFVKLIDLRFVFTDERIKSFDEFFCRYKFSHPHIVIGYGGYGDTPFLGELCACKCKMTLTGFRTSQVDYITISVDDWIANHWPAYDAA